MVATVRASQWTLTITILDESGDTIGGPYDYSSAALDVELQFPEIRTGSDPNTYLPWTATVTLLDGIAPFSLDNRDTAASPTGASLLALGNQIALQLNGQRSWPPLYILQTADPLTVDQQPIRIELGDISQLSDIFTPENDYSDITLGASTAPHVAINEIAQAADIPTTSDTITTSYNLTAPVPKNDTRSWPEAMGAISACNGYCVWLNDSEDLRLTQIDLDKSSPDIALTIGRDEVGTDGWVPQNFDEQPPGSLEVIGGGGKGVQVENPRTIPVTVAGDGFTSLTSEETTTITPGGGAPTTVVEYAERQASNQIRPIITTFKNVEVTQEIEGEPPTTVFVKTPVSRSDNTSTGLRDCQDKIIPHRFNGITNSLTRTVTELEIARGLAGGDAYRDTDEAAAYDQIEAERTVVEYEYDNVTGRVKKITEETRKPYCLFNWGEVRPEFYELNRLLTRTSYRRTTEWRRVLSPSGDPTIETWEQDQETERPRGVLYPEYTGDNPETLITDPSREETFKITASDGSTAPPDTIYQDPLWVQDETQFSGTVDITPPSGDAHKLKDGHINISTPAIVSDAQCSFLAELFGRWQHGLSLGYSFIGAVPTAILSSFSPVMRVDVTDGGVTTAYIMNGFSIIGNAEETLFGCNLVNIGVVGETPDALTSPVTISFSMTASTPVAMPQAVGEIEAIDPIDVSASTPVTMPGVSAAIEKVDEPSSALDQNLVAHWRMNGDGNDSSGNSNNLTSSPTAMTYTTGGGGKLGEAAIFPSNGTQYLELNSSALTSPPGDFAFAIWVDIQASNNGGTILGATEGDVAQPDRAYQLTYDSEEWIWSVGTGGIFEFDNDTTLGWRLIVCQFVSSSRTLQLSIDGGSFFSATSSQDPTTAFPFRIGADGQGLSALRNAKVDDVRFYDRVLTTDDVAELWNNGNGVT